MTPYALGEAQIAVVLDALEVAAEYRRYRADHAPCDACYRARGEFCDDHATDLERAAEYDELADQIRNDDSCPCGLGKPGDCPGLWHGCDFCHDGDDGEPTS